MRATHSDFVAPGNSNSAGHTHWHTNWHPLRTGPGLRTAGNSSGHSTSRPCAFWRGLLCSKRMRGRNLRIQQAGDAEEAQGVPSVRADPRWVVYSTRPPPPPPSFQASPSTPSGPCRTTAADSSATSRSLAPGCSTPGPGLGGGGQPPRREDAACADGAEPGSRGRSCVEAETLSQPPLV